MAFSDYHENSVDCAKGKEDLQVALKTHEKAFSYFLEWRVREKNYYINLKLSLEIYQS